MATVEFNLQDKICKLDLDVYDAIGGHRRLRICTQAPGYLIIRGGVFSSAKYVHRRVANAQPGERVYFKNKDIYDCRRSNLEIKPQREVSIEHFKPGRGCDTLTTTTHFQVQVPMTAEWSAPASPAEHKTA